MTTTPPYEPYREVPTGTFRWRLGVRPLDLADWLVITDHYNAEVTAKARIMADHPEPYTVAALEPAVVLSIPKASVRRLMGQSSAFDATITGEAASQNLSPMLGYRFVF